MLDVPTDLLARRRRLGHDRFDEMWECELHMVPPPNEEHQRVGGRLYALLLAVADEVGLHARYETGVFDPALVEVDGGPDGEHRLDALDVTLSTHDGQLVAGTATIEVRI